MKWARRQKGVTRLKGRKVGPLALAIIVTFGLVFAACCPAPTGTNVYSKFGFSFEYPAGATLTEAGVYAATADEYSGLVGWEVGDDLFGITWEKSEVWSSELAESYIDFVILGVEQAGGVVELIGGKVTSEMGGFEVTYQLFELAIEGEEYNAIYAIWYCEPGTRVFDAIFLVAGAPLPYLKDFMPTFECQ